MASSSKSIPVEPKARLHIQCIGVFAKRYSNEDEKITLRLSNVHSSPNAVVFAFRISTSSPGRYKASPAFGVLPPKSYIDVIVTKLASCALSATAFNGDRLMLSSRFIPEYMLQQAPIKVWGETEQVTTIDQIWLPPLPEATPAAHWAGFLMAKTCCDKINASTDEQEPALILSEPQDCQYMESDIDPEAGRGGQATVMKGFARLKNSKVVVEVAIKHLNLKDLRRQQKALKKELVLFKINHENIVPILGAHSSVNPRSATLLLPWCWNGEVPKFVKRTSATKERRLGLMVDVAQGLQHLKTFGIIHGDLKGNNVLVNNIGRAMIIDFGLSSLVDSEQGTAATTNGGAGNERWMAFELLPDMSLPVGEAGTPPKKSYETDVFAFGCVALEIGTGRIPLRHYHTQQITQDRHLISLPEDYLELPEESLMWGLMRDCWEVAATRRPPVEDILKQLDEILATDGSTWLTLSDSSLECASKEDGRTSGVTTGGTGGSGGTTSTV